MSASRRLVAAAFAGAILAAGACAANAAAATVAVTTGCVIFTGSYADQVLPIAGTGFAPASLVTLTTSTSSKPSSASLTSVQANAAGNFFAVAGGARFNSTQTQDQTFKLTATDAATPSITAATTFRQVRAGYTRDPAPTQPEQWVTHIARGFTDGGRIYAHFRHHGTTRTTKSLGLAKGPCGIAKRKMRVLPTKSRLGTWKVAVDPKKTYSRKTRPQARLSFKVTLGVL